MKPVVFWIAIALGIISITLAFASQNNIAPLARSLSYSCDVRVDNILFLDSRIGSASCVPDGTCSALLSRVGPQAIFSDPISLRASTSDGWAASASADVTESSFRTLKFSPCTDADKVSFVLYASGERVDTKEVVLR